MHHVVVAMYLFECTNLVTEMAVRSKHAVHLPVEHFALLSLVLHRLCLSLAESMCERASLDDPAVAELLIRLALLLLLWQRHRLLVVDLGHVARVTAWHKVLALVLSTAVVVQSLLLLLRESKAVLSCLRLELGAASSHRWSERFEVGRFAKGTRACHVVHL